LIGAQTIFDKASAIAVLLPATGSSKAATGECPIEVAIPSFRYNPKPLHHSYSTAIAMVL
jgi:hypothetical protein